MRRYKLCNDKLQVVSNSHGLKRFILNSILYCVCVYSI
nr:MAG TPA: hypothetical protein [Ackermannviridae sp.]